MRFAVEHIFWRGSDVTHHALQGPIYATLPWNTAEAVCGSDYDTGRSSECCDCGYRKRDHVQGRKPQPRRAKIKSCLYIDDDGSYDYSAHPSTWHWCGSCGDYHA